MRLSERTVKQKRIPLTLAFEWEMTREEIATELVQLEDYNERLLKLAAYYIKAYEDLAFADAIRKEQPEPIPADDDVKSS